MKDLRSAAGALHDVLMEPSLGGCVPALPGRSAFPGGAASLITGDDLDSAEITAMLRAAVQYAGERGAVLVLALLGHGFRLGSTLYLMGADSREGVRDRAVDIGAELLVAVDHPGIQGVIAVVDTCHAGAAAVHPTEISKDRARLAVLMGALPHEPAYDLRLSKALAALIRDGSDHQGPLLTVAGAATRLRELIVGQSVLSNVHDGDHFSYGELWLARNTGHRAVPGVRRSGRLAVDELAEALGAVTGLSLTGAVDPEAGDFGIPTVLEARRRLTALPASPARDRALRAVDGQLIALRTVDFIGSWMGAGLTTLMLRRAVHTLLSAEGRLPADTRLLTRPTLTDVVDQMVFDHPVTDPDCRPGLTTLVLLLAHEAGMDDTAPELRRWAEQIDAVVALNDAVDLARAKQGDRRLSLVVSLHASLAGDWPESLEAWLLDNGHTHNHWTFPCPAADRHGVETALEDAVLWAEDLAESLEYPLRRLDIAVPTGLLLKWRPEEAGEILRLGVSYDVVVHWSQRLSPTRALRLAQSALRNCWNRIGAPESDIPLDWITGPDTPALTVLSQHLRDGRFGKGIALTHHPGANEQLMDLLLTYTPVLLWPHGPDGGRVRADWLDRHWPRMPEVLMLAYRCRWQDEPDDGIGGWRAVWDDPEWLRFCSRLTAGQTAERRTTWRGSE
ncbi:caspase family protein [Streptomyces sp. PCS3-D2]|uniref:vWA-MoxR associated conflict system protein n=1 Tax=Streptomyces sp. PCS3-D2 TaxID=1460244 RepID=UPI000449943D|nr:caspase family protein [Streptomyces sp. PCS3-D2]WKV75808.1 caspase family protein [Streptomyces sp. PCS3-D2]